MSVFVIRVCLSIYILINLVKDSFWDLGAGVIAIRVIVIVQNFAMISPQNPILTTKGPTSLNEASQ